MNQPSEDFMTRFPRPRDAASLSDSIVKRLNAYTLAAGAAGVGVFGLAPPVEAKIVYTSVNVVIRLNTSYNLDLNHDGVTDFRILRVGGSFGYMAVFSIGSNRVWGSRDIVKYQPAASHLGAGVRIGPKRVKEFRKGDMYCGSLGGTFSTCKWMIRRNGGGPYYGPWVTPNSGYLGLKFFIGGQIHYGWARFRKQKPIIWVLTGYAYETIPNKAIVAGATKGPDDVEPTASITRRPTEPATLGLLALGAPGLPIWRREDGIPAARGD
jgi:hypothetical protein